MKLMHKFILLLTIVGIGLVGAFLWYKEGSLPVDKSAQEQSMFIIAPGQPLNAIINKLEQEKFIRNKVVFFMIVKQMGIEKLIQAGNFRLSQSMNAREIATKLTQGSEDQWVTVIEGLRKEEIAKVFAQEINIDEAEFNALAKEGYLFPDTYLIPKGADAQKVIDIMRANYESKMSDQIREKARQLGLSERELVIMASIIEKEGRSEDRAVVADVLMRRFSENYPLQADATVQYALGYQANIAKWWKPGLLFEDLKLESPYNTYTNEGLPPTPICNPGISSIEAVANANPKTPYFYYLHAPDGTVHPSRTLEEHEAKTETYLN